jgi:hypothetical protein
VQECTTEPVLNLDRVGISDWEDRKMKNVIIPAMIPSEPIVHGISRNVKHISVISCASTTAKSLVPYIIPLPDFISVRG